MEDLRDVILVGHSYGGMVATGVADREARAHRASRLPGRVRAARRPVGAGSAPPGNAGAYPVGGARRRRMASAAESPTARHSKGGSGMDDAAPDAAAGEDRRAADSPDRRRGTPAALLHLLFTAAAGRRLPAVRGSCAKRTRLAVSGDRREPQPAHHGARRARRDAAIDSCRRSDVSKAPPAHVEQRMRLRRDLRPGRATLRRSRRR